MDSWFVQILSETTRVWNDGGKLLKSVDAKSSQKLDDQCLLIFLQSSEALSIWAYTEVPSSILRL